MNNDHVQEHRYFTPIRKPPLRWKSYLGNFMLLNMIGFLWLDGRKIDWPGSNQ